MSAPSPLVSRAPACVNMLDVFVTDRCNLACASCCVHTVKGRRGATTLAWPDLRAALDLFLDPARVPHAGRKEIALAGGEPFLHYPLLLKAARHLRGFSPAPRAYVHTNGTAAKAAQVRALVGLGMGVIFSIDGSREDHDRYRPYAGRSARSAFDAAMGLLHGLPPEGLATNTVLRPDTLAGIVGLLDGFSALGIATCDLWIDYLRTWSDGELARLARFTAELGEYYGGRAEREGRLPFYLPALHHALFCAGQLRLGKAWWRDCFRLTLGADGNYYACEAVGCFPYGKGSRYAIGRARDGAPDWEARARSLAAADSALDGLGAGREAQHICPRLYRTIADIRGTDPAPAVANLHRVTRVFYEGLLRLAARLKALPAFRRRYLEGGTL